MGDSLVVIVVILLSAVLMFVFPMSAMSERNDDVSQLQVQTAITEFVNSTRNTGKITIADYDKLIASLNATGNTYKVELEIQNIDSNPSKKKVTQSSIHDSSEYKKVGENVYFSIYTSQIMDELDSKGVKYMKEGDILIAKASNTNSTISQMFKNFLYGLTGNNTYSIIASDSGIVTVTGTAS